MRTHTNTHTEYSPSGSGTDAASYSTATRILSIYSDTVLLTLSQSVLNALFNLALIRLAGGDALHVHRTAWHFLAAVFHVDLVAAAVVRKIGGLVLSVTEILNFHSARHLIWSLREDSGG